MKTIMLSDQKTGTQRTEVRVLENRTNKAFRHCVIGKVTLKPKLGPLDGYRWPGFNLQLMNASLQGY